jgi:hypothetical protein
MNIEKFDPNDIDNRARPDGFLFNKIKKEEHTNCGTPECCGTCDTADTKSDSDG